MEKGRTEAPARSGLEAALELLETRLNSAHQLDKGVLLCRHVGFPQLLPQEKFADYPMPKLDDVDHYLQWTNAIRGEGKTTSNFDYAGPLTEMVLLGSGRSSDIVS